MSTTDEATAVTFTLKGADGKDVQVQVPREAVLDAVKETHVPASRFDAEIDRRVKGIVKNQGLRKAEELLDDESFAAQVAEKHGLVKKSDGAPDAAAQSQQLKDAIAKALADVEAKRIKPLEEKLTAKEAREEALLAKDLERQIIQAAAPYVRKALLKSPAAHKQAPIVAMLADMFAYDAESGEFYVADGKDNFVLSTRRDSTSPFKTVDEAIAEWVANKENADFLLPGQTGPGAGGGAGGQHGAVMGAITLSAEEASDAEVFRAALAKVGGDVTKVRVRRPGEHV